MNLVGYWFCVDSIGIFVQGVQRNYSAYNNSSLVHLNRRQSCEKIGLICARLGICERKMKYVPRQGHKTFKTLTLVNLNSCYESQCHRSD